jgi:phosphatidate cytidylyltransferase
MAPLGLGAVLLGRPATIGLFTIVSLIGMKEYARATGLYRDWGMAGICYLGIIALGVTAFVNQPATGVPGWYGLFMTLPVYVVGAIVMVPVIRNQTKGQLQEIGLAVLGFIYLGWMLLHAAFLANCDHAYGYLLFLVLAVELNDVAAFICGKAFGKRQFRSNISPKKTWGGAIGAATISMAMPWLLRFSFPHFGPLQLILTGLIVGVGGQIGDLVISVIKRDVGIKDTGALIPGHGGILDRVDSLIFAAPLFAHMVDFFYVHW